MNCPDCNESMLVSFNGEAVEWKNGKWCVIKRSDGSTKIYEWGCLSCNTVKDRATEQDYLSQKNSRDKSRV